MNHFFSLLRLAAQATLIMAVAAGTASAQLAVTGSSKSYVNLPADFDAKELSGITWAGGNTYYAVGDKDAGHFYQLTIDLDRATGAITQARVTGTVSASLSEDAEDIAYHPGRNTVFISAESDNSIREFPLTGGHSVGSISIPAVYANARSNYGFEALSYGAGSYWFCNEEALKTDGLSSFELMKQGTGGGTLVRFQQLGEDFSPVGQWAYLVDPVSGDVTFPATDAERSGVSALLALPDGNLLVLEREFGTGGSGSLPQFRHRIYLADFTGATDISGYEALDAEASFQTVGKTLLWEGSYNALELTNYEGMCLGPMNEDGSWNLLLISDNGSGAGQRLLSLQLSGLLLPIPEPSGVLLLLVSAGLCAKRRRA